MRVKGSIGLLAVVLAACGGDERVAGNGTNIGNALVSGRILSPSGTPAEGVWIECVPDTLAPWDARRPGWTTLTDSAGRYRCTDLPDGRIGVAAYDPSSGLTRWHADTLVLEEPGNPRTDTLASPGRIRIALPPGTNGILHFSGLTRTVSVHGDQEILVDGIPAGWTGSLKLARTITSIDVVDSTLRIRPGAIDSAGYTRRDDTLRIALAGGLQGALRDLPILVRLDSTWSGFARSLPDGSDLRLTTVAGKALPLTVASWNREAKSGALWTLVDSLAAPGDSIDLVLASGIPVPATTPAAAFSATRGWIGAWPLGDSGKTANDLLGAYPGSNASTVATAGVVAKATRFDGRSSQITFPGSESNALSRAEGADLTYSCWARLATPVSNTYLMGHGRYGTALYVQIAGGRNWWNGREYRSSPAGSDYRRGYADTAVWTHLALTVSRNAVSMYVNGVRANDSGFNNDDIARKALPFLIGTGIDTLGLTSTYGHFSGDIDEVWMQSVARGADWIRFVAANQRPDASPARPLP